jgi:TolB-like protein/Tfp pilus assembly protein PilF
LGGGGWFEELKQRRVFRAVVGYGVVAFAVLQVVEPVMHGLGLPEWTLAATVVALGLGFPVTLVLAWIFDVREGRVEKTDPRPRTRALVLLVAAGLVLGAPGVAWFFWRAHRAPATAATVEVEGPPSVAVLAFTDLSPAKDQEYFSDGIAEEILDALARVKGLRVAGRTSSFQYKGRNEDLRTIGRALGVAHVLEGSVRRQGNKVRITAQLVKAADGFHLWSRSFDGDLTDVFELQERIARAVAAELSVVLQGPEQDRLVPVATSSAEAYALFLKATAIFNRRDGVRFGEAIAELEEALKLDPRYARAESRLATLYALMKTYRPAATGDFFAETEAHAALGLALQNRRRFAESRAAFDRALALDPDDVTANFWAGTALSSQGYLARANARLDHVLELDPAHPNANYWRGATAYALGDVATSERLVAKAQELGLVHAGLLGARFAARHGRNEEAAAVLATALGPQLADLPPGSAEVIARGVFSDAAAHARALEVVNAYLASRPLLLNGNVPYALLLLAEPPERALELLGRGLTSNDSTFFGMVWSPEGRAARTSPAFAPFARKIGLAEIWDREGAPDLCERKAPGEYVCR